MTKSLSLGFAAAVSLLLAVIAGDTPAAADPYAICKSQTYALCASAQAFVYQEVSYAKCIVKNGNSISAPPLTYQDGNQEKNICNFNAEGVGNGYMASTFSLPPEVTKVGGKEALYTCPGGSTGDYAQCDGGTCFTSTQGKTFPGVGKLGPDEIVCSCPITKTSTSAAPFGYQFIGPFPCQPAAFSACNLKAKNGDIIPVGSPPGAGRALSRALYGRNFRINECFMQ